MYLLLLLNPDAAVWAGSFTTGTSCTITGVKVYRQTNHHLKNNLRTDGCTLAAAITVIIGYRYRVFGSFHTVVLPMGNYFITVF